MEQQNSFSYSYSAPDNQEVLSIRKKYLPQPESKLEELKRLDQLVQNSGVVTALVLGVISCLVFGVGMCFGLGVLGSCLWPCIPFGLVGTVGMLLAYPVHKKLFAKAKAQHTPRILELTAELSRQN